MDDVKPTWRPFLGDPSAKVLASLPLGLFQVGPCFQTAQTTLGRPPFTTKHSFSAFSPPAQPPLSTQLLASTAHPVLTEAAHKWLLKGSWLFPIRT